MTIKNEFNNGESPHLFLGSLASIFGFFEEKAKAGHKWFSGQNKPTQVIVGLGSLAGSCAALYYLYPFIVLAGETFLNRFPGSEDLELPLGEQEASEETDTSDSSEAFGLSDEKNEADLESQEDSKGLGLEVPNDSEPTNAGSNGSESTDAKAGKS